MSVHMYRISRSIYARGLTASGAANRWNLANEFVIYAGSTRSLSTLEMVVHRTAIRPHDDYKMMVIQVPKDIEMEQIEIEDLPKNWRSIGAYPALQQIGSLWYRSRRTAICKIPSVVIPQEHNYMIHTHHVDFSRITLHSTEAFLWDRRLL